MPVGVGPDTITATASQTLTAGMFVNVYDNAGTKSVRKAVATDATKPANGYVLAGYAISDPATVYMGSGQNTLVPVGSFVAADVGKQVFLDPTTGGSCTLTPPSTAGQLQQLLGTVSDVGATASVQFDFCQGYVM
jgi:hypothetical protein